MDLREDNEIRIGELPDLHIMPIDRIVFHEEPDPERSLTLEIFLQKEGILKNPPVVAFYNHHERSILLDGANRITALQKLGVKDVLVQQIDLFDPGLNFLNWHHAVEYIPKKTFLQKISAIAGIECTPYSQTESDSENEEHLLAQIFFRDGDSYNLSVRSDLLKKIDALNRFCHVYKGSRYMDRVSYTNFEHLRGNYPNFSALVCFRKFTKQELITVVQNGRKLPSGVTRIILPKRALRLNVPLDILRFEAPVEEKNHWLQKRINLQVKDKSIRFYHEPTFLFDE